MEPQTGRSGRAALRLAPFLAALAAFLAFLPALRNGFVDFDDAKNIVLNEHYRGLGWANLRWMLTAAVTGVYQPLAWMSLGLDYVLWGLDPFGYHLTNILLHAFCAGALYLLCQRLLAWPEKIAAAWTPTLAGAAMFGALSWALHPLRVESVAWVTERRDVLSTALYLSTVILYLRWVESGLRRWLAAACGVYALSLSAKAMGMTLPLALLILDAYPLRRGLRLKDKLPLFALASFAGAYAALRIRTETTALSLADFGIGQRLARASWALVFYLRKTVWPSDLAALYEMPSDFRPVSAPYILSGAALVLLAAAVWRLRRRVPGLAAAAGFYLVSVLPVLGLQGIGMHMAADRYCFLPMIGFSVLAAAGLRRLLETARSLAPAVLAAGALLLAVWGGLSWRQCRYWKDADALWGRVLSLAPDTAMAQHNLCVVAADRGELPAAVEHCRRAAAIKPQWRQARATLARTLYDLANARSRAGAGPEAAALYQEALRAQPEFPEALNNLGLALARQGRAREACGYYERAAGWAPERALIYYNWGNALADLGRLSQAEAKYRQALEREPGNLDARFNLGNVLARQGRYRDAAAAYREVADKAPEFPDARARLAAALRLGGR